MKKVYNSKTVWFNLVLLVVGSVPAIGTFVKLVEPKTAVIVDGVVVLVGVIGNQILRIWFTDMPIDTPKARAKSPHLFKSE